MYIPGSIWQPISRPEVLSFLFMVILVNQPFEPQYCILITYLFCIYLEGTRVDLSSCLVFPVTECVLHDSWWLQWLTDLRCKGDGWRPAHSNSEQLCPTDRPWWSGLYDDWPEHTMDGTVCVCVWLGHLCSVSHVTLPCWGVSCSLCHHSSSHCKAFLKVWITQLAEWMNLTLPTLLINVNKKELFDCISTK